MKKRALMKKISNYPNRVDYVFAIRNGLNRFLLQSFLLSIFWILPLSVCFAGQVSINASVDKNIVAIGDVIEYTMTISGEGINNNSEPSTPSFSNLRVISKSQSSNISIINTQVSTAHSYTYILSPEKEGAANIGVASVIIGKNTYQSQPISITITKPISGTKQSSQRQQARRAINPFDIWNNSDDFFNEARRQAQIAQPISEPIIAATTLSRHTCYVNQMVILTFTFYRRVNLFESPSYSPPSTIGFWSVELPQKKEAERYENVKGIRYLAQDMKTALFPTQPGELTIGSATIIARLDPFSAPITVPTNPLKIKVLPLPKQGKGGDSASMVGRFTMTAAVDKKVTERGKPFTLKVKIDGTGNIHAIPEPLVLIDNNLKKLSVHAADNIIKGFDSVSGSKTFEYIIMPIKEGNGKVGPIKLTYFDPFANKYINLSANPFRIKVLPSNIPLTEEETKLPEKLEKKVVMIDNRIITKTMQVISIIILSGIIVFIIRGAIRKYRKYLDADPVRNRQQMAMKKARQSLKKARGLFKNNNLTESIARSYDAVVYYLGDKYNFESTGITHDQLKDILSQQGITPDIREEIDNFIFECDMIRWTPSSLDRGKVDEIIRIADGLIMGKMRGKVEMVIGDR
ncbi:MAG: BatD family protein [Candidatus Desantisbacteria bacterium]